MDAYTLRKMAPRLLMAVIAVNLSIYLCLAAVDITNIIGKGLGELFLTPFSDAQIFDIQLKNNTENGLVGGAGLLAGAGVLGTILAAIFAGGAVAASATAAVATASAALIPFLFLCVVSIGFVALAVLLTVIIRQGLLVFLIIVSPIAIALFVLPGTEKFFRQWWSIFLKTLMVYPIIAAIFAMSDILGAIIMDGATKESVSGTAGLAMVMTGIIVVYAPLFMIPFAFKFAGGILGAMYDIAQGQTSKASGGLRNKIKQSRDDPNSWLGGMKKSAREQRNDAGLTAGHVFGGISAGVRGRRDGIGFRRGYSADARTRSARLGNKAARESQELDAAKEIVSDDDASSVFNVAARGGSRAAQEAEAARVAPTRFKRGKLDQTDAERMGYLKRNAETGDMEWNDDLGGKKGFEKALLTENTAKAIAARNKSADDVLAQVGSLKSRTGSTVGQQMALRNIAATTTGYKSNAEMTQRVVEASRREDGTVDMQQVAIALGETKKAAMGVGRVDYGGSSFTRHFAVAQELANGTMSLNEAEKQLSASVIKKQDASTLARMDTRAMEVMAPHLTVEMENAVAAARADGRPVMQDAKVQAASAKLANIYDSLNYANSGNADLLAKVMGDKNMDIDGSGKSIRGIIEEMRGKAEDYEAFANIRKDWGMGSSARGLTAEQRAKMTPEEIHAAEAQMKREADEYQKRASER